MFRGSVPHLLRVAFLAATAFLVVSCRRAPDVTAATVIQTPPRIDPDYTSLVIPPNIAPLNFRIKEEGVGYVVRISSEASPPLELHCPGGTCAIPLKAWRNMLRDNTGKSLRYDIYVKKNDGAWTQYGRITNTVAMEPVDSYIVYRRLVANKGYSRIKGIFQRNIETFDRSALMKLRDGTFFCFNCHTFHQNNPNKFLFHMRVMHPGMMLVMDGKARKINTKQDPMFRPLAYASWHPDGRHIAATMNQFVGHRPFNERLYYFEAVEKRGDLVVYDVENNTISTTKAVFENKYIETHPCWSHDGKFIYFVRDTDRPLRTVEDLHAFRSDLMRISYDTDTGAWGSPETVKAYSDLGTSCSFPRPSRCGRYILHILADKTTYPIHQRSSDVFLLDLESKKHRRLDEVCSDFAESYPRWSSNGRWFSFVSNRRDGISALPYFAYFDTQGQAHKAFVLPQKDPKFYDTFVDTYNIVEMVKSRVNISEFELARAMQLPAVDALFPNPPGVDAYTGPTRAAR